MRNLHGNTAAPLLRVRSCLLALMLWGTAGVRSDESGLHWPQWRGPAGTGVAASGNPPMQWDASRNIAWKVAVPGQGHSTPIVWAGKLFLLTAVPVDKDLPSQEVDWSTAPEQALHTQTIRDWTAQRFVVLCFDAATGAVRWQRDVREARPHQSHHRKGAFACASPVTDGEHLFTWFGSFGLYCFDLHGRLIWEKDLGPFIMEDGLGEGSSPALHGDTLVINADHEGQSFIVALDKATGVEKWRQNRDEISTWSTPTIFEREGRARVVSNATCVRCYDLKTGELLWQCRGQTESAVPMPVVGHDMVFVTSGFADDVLHAIRLGRRGDLTDTDAVAWSLDRGTPYVPTPLLWGEELYVLEDRSFLSCLDAKTGRSHYFKRRLPGTCNFSASPVGAADRIHLLSESGDTYVLKRGTGFEVIGVNRIGEACYASPAVVGNTIYIRSVDHLWCIRDSSSPRPGG